ncbi:recombinase D [Candidatus Magnetobacterium bavaricum]|uniref:Recombinase D n=1 Tax=Candidatus Magnetobacterium bavaricum TaxID=29290 RepID=A0A0F3GVL7_9BACT|nr:recombinase D [Candidatus Magnetobacterium bavaricum]
MNTTSHSKSYYAELVEERNKPNLADTTKIEANVQALCRNFKLSDNVLSRIVKKYGKDAEKTVRDNPYQLIKDIAGIGFITADSIALALGYEKEGAYRIEAAILHTLKEGAQSSGHTCMPYSYLVKNVVKVLKVNEDKIRSTLDVMIIKGSLIGENHLIALKHYYNAEVSIANNLNRLMTSDVDTVQGESNPDGLEEDQREALNKAITSKVFILTGAPGTGKTFTIKKIIEAFSGQAIVLAAPTGKAAKRIFEQTGIEAYTIHRLLGAQMKDGRFVFAHNQDCPLHEKVVIIDEVSMVDVNLMVSLLEAIPSGAWLILVGDSYQLPSVGPGHVLKDIIQSGQIITMELTQIKRQAAGLIIRNCHRIKNGQDIIVENSTSEDFFILKRDLEWKIRDTVIELHHRLRVKGYDPIRDIQILTPFRKRTELSCERFNDICQSKLNPNPATHGLLFAIGDKVIQTRNNYNLEIFNGDIGYVMGITSSRKVKVFFDNPERLIEVPPGELQLAYAITIHKSQGSEWPIVILPIHKSFGGFIVNRNLLYTAISRAKKKCIIVGHRDELKSIIKRNQVQRRFTHLERLLRQAIRKSEQSSDWLAEAEWNDINELGEDPLLYGVNG